MQSYIKPFAASVADWVAGDAQRPIYEIVDFSRYSTEIKSLAALSKPAAPPSDTDEQTVLAFAHAYICCLGSLANPREARQAFQYCTKALQLFDKIYTKVFEQEDSLDAAQAFQILLQKSLGLAKQVGRTEYLDEKILFSFMRRYLRIRLLKKEDYAWDRQAGLMLLQICTARLGCQLRTKRYISAASHIIKPCEAARLEDFVPTAEEAACGRTKSGGGHDWIPKSVWVTFCYYYGRVALFAEELEKAHRLLTMAFKLCHAGAESNLRRIAFFLIPLNLRRLSYPSVDLLRRTKLVKVFGPLVLTVMDGDLLAFRQFLTRHCDTFLRLQLTCLLRPLELVVFANLCRRLGRTKATHGGRLLALSDIVSGSKHAVDELEAECLVTALRASHLRILGGCLVQHAGKYQFQFVEDPDRRVRKVVQNFGAQRPH